LNEPSKTLLAAAEELLRRAAADGDQGRAALAAFLGRRGVTAEALAIWSEFFGGPGFETAALGCSVLAAAHQLDVDQLADVERRLNQSSQQHAESLAVLAALAVIHDAQGRFDQAERIYRLILGRDGEHVMALNNLALNLALRNQAGKEGLGLIDRAIAESGPVPTMLDTRASVYLALGNGEKAIADLDEAIAQAPAATYYFHLARAHLLEQNPEGAAAAMIRAKEAGLREEILHPLERGEYQKVLAAVSSK